MIAGLPSLNDPDSLTTEALTTEAVDADAARWIPWPEAGVSLGLDDAGSSVGKKLEGGVPGSLDKDDGEEEICGRTSEKVEDGVDITSMDLLGAGESDSPSGEYKVTSIEPSELDRDV